MSASRHPQHVAEGTEHDIGERRDGQCTIDGLQRGHADRAPRTVQQLQPRGQQLVDAVDDGGRVVVV